MIGHLRGLFFVEFGASGSHSPVVSLLYALTGLGHQSVIIFFVLSGFFVAGSAIRRLPDWSWTHYLGNRVTRLYLVLLPALLLTAAADQISLRLPLGPQYFEHPIPHFNAPPITAAISAKAFLANAVFLQTIVAPPFGSNFPLWSLANEFWYYLLFPLATLAVFRGTPQRRIFCACAALGIAVALPWEIMVYFPIWLMGAALSVFPAPRLGPGVLMALRVSLLAVFAGTLLLSRTGRLSSVPGDYCIAIAFSLWMLSLIATSTSVGTDSVGRTYKLVAATVAGCSYSLYATHMPLLLLARSAYTNPPVLPSLTNCGFAIVLGSAVSFGAFLFSRVTEARTDVVRNSIFRSLGV